MVKNYKRPIILILKVQNPNFYNTPFKNVFDPKLIKKINSIKWQ